MKGSALVDGVDLYFSEFSPETPAPVVVLALLVDGRELLPGAAVVHNFDLDRSAGHRGTADRCPVTIGNHEDVIEHNLLARLPVRIERDTNHRVRLHLELKAGHADNRVHSVSSSRARRPTP